MTDATSEAQKPTGMRLFAAALPLLCALHVCAEEASPITIQEKSVDKSLTTSLKGILRRETKPSSSKSVKIIIQWDFGKNSGEFLLVDIKTAGKTSCIIYIRNQGVYRSLGGNDNCTWKRTPKLVWKDDFAWIDFRASPYGRTATPVVHKELTAHFNKASGAICLLGLPIVGFDDLRCPDDEPPASK